MPLHFDPQSGLYADEIETVREAVRLDWTNAFAREGLPALNTEPETPAGQLIDSQTAAIADKDSEVLFLGNQFNPYVASGVWQDALGKIYFLTRKVAQPSEAVCLCRGLVGTTIPAGARIKSTADSSEWICANTVTLGPQQYANVRFMSAESGPVAAQAGTLTQIVTVTPGWDSVTNEAPATVGRLAETQLEFEQRRFDSVAANSRGSVYSLYGALADLENVLVCAVLENITNVPVTKWGVEIPGHSVYISIVGGDDGAIAETIYRKKDMGCGTAGNTSVTYQDASLPGTPIYTYQIERPEAVTFGVRVTMKLTSTTPADIEDLVKEAVLAEFNGTGPHAALRISMAQNVYASRFYCAVITAGVQELVSIEVAAPVTDAESAAWADEVTFNADKQPTLDAQHVFVVIQGQVQ